MKTLINKKKFQSVVCLKDYKDYIYNIDKNPSFLDDDFALIKCFMVKEDGTPDFSKEIEIYGKYLVKGGTK